MASCSSIPPDPPAIGASTHHRRPSGAPCRPVANAEWHCAGYFQGLGQGIQGAEAQQSAANKQGRRDAGQSLSKHAFSRNMSHRPEALDIFLGPMAPSRYPARPVAGCRPPARMPSISSSTAPKLPSLARNTGHIAAQWRAQLMGHVSQ